MVNLKNAVLFALLLSAGIFAFFYFFQSDEAKIKRRFDQLKVELQKDSAETELLAAAKARRTGRMFTDPCFLKIPSHSISGTWSRKELISHVLAARMQYDAISIRFHDLQIVFTDDETATVSLTVMAEAVPRGDTGEIPFEEVQELTCIHRQIDGEWFFSEAEAVEVLKK